ncbi:MAG: flagellar export chaperone FliS [Thiobacillus sp.]
MTTSSRTATQAYAHVGLETGVAAASQKKLILMLYDGAELAVRMAITHTHAGELTSKSAAITKAMNIILEGLRAALDMEKGGDLAIQLAALYDYMNARLLHGHVNNEVTPLEEVLALLRELHSAWKQIPDQSALQPIAHAA